MKRFMRMMGSKVRLQAQSFPDLFPCEDYSHLKTFADFDNRYTAPLHGFRDASHYWDECSCKRYLGHIKLPVWIINAANDPFLTTSCYPVAEEHCNPKVTLLKPAHGGHCGFASTSLNEPYWSEIVSARLLSLFR